MWLSVTIRKVKAWSVVWVTWEMVSYVPYATVPSWEANLKMPTTVQSSAWPLIFKRSVLPGAMPGNLARMSSLTVMAFWSPSSSQRPETITGATNLLFTGGARMVSVSPTVPSALMASADVYAQPSTATTPGTCRAVFFTSFRR